MISINGVDYLKAMAESQADIISGGVIYLIVEGDTFTWRKASKAFDLDIFQVGEKININSIVGRAIKENRTITQNVPRSLYGTRLITSAQPLVNEEGQTVGAFSVVFPRLHPVARSFKDFAPILAEMFPEGAFLYVTDLNKFINRQPPKKFDIPTLQLEYELKEEDVSIKAIKTKQAVTMEVDSSKFGVPVLVTCYPLFDEDNSGEVVATLGVVIPKVLASNLSNMSANLESGLAGIASAIEQMAAPASNIHINEQELNKEIREIISLSEEITASIQEITFMSEELNKIAHEL